MAVTVSTLFREIGRVDRLSDVLDVRMEGLVVLKRKNQALEDKISYYSSTAGIIDLAREEFNLVRPGEKMYKIEIISEDKLRNQ
jgi:cell division protein FtsB